MPAFFKADLAAGRLVQPFDIMARDNQSYWLVYAEGRGNTPKIQAFRDWVLAEVKRDASANDGTNLSHRLRHRRP